MAKRKQNNHYPVNQDPLKAEQLAFNELIYVIKSLNQKGHYWIELSNNGIIFNIKLLALFPDFFDEDVNIPVSSIRRYVNNKVIHSYGDFSGFSLMKTSECASSFLTPVMNKAYYRNNSFNIAEYLTVKDDDTGKVCVYSGNDIKSFHSNNPTNKVTMYIPLHYLERNSDENWNPIKAAIVMLSNGLIPIVKIAHYNALIALYEEYGNGRREIDENGIISKVDVVLNMTMEKDYSQPTNDNNQWQEQKIVNIENKQVSQLDNNKLSNDEKLLLECDRVRFGYLVYDKDRLYDLRSGHWDIYDENINQDTYLNEKGFVARNPNLDVQKNGIVAIDFGTKSTVVVYKNGNTTKIPMRIGATNLKKDISEVQYENPTVEEFVDIRSFIKDYHASEGRPKTKWSDLIIANVAQKDMLDNASSLKEHYSYFSEIKQWASGQADAVICDQKSNFSPKMSEYISGQSELDLVEIYAYFIGLHINNMQNGIFLKYKLSFPVSFEKKVCEKIRISFERGIKKTIPVQVQNNEEILKKFKVQLSASEPAAYATCAIQQYNLNVNADEALFYSVFDFGGGTSDFDFGYWKACDDDESKYTYELHRITSNGDKYLGGENILLLAAYEVFRQNFELLKKNNIPFIKPEFCERFVGDDLLVANPPTRIARRNMYAMKEILRFFWESDYSQYLEKTKEKISLDLIDTSGKAHNDLPVEVNYQKVYDIIKKRIKEGVEQFDVGRKKALEHMTKVQREHWLSDTQHIFLAGNSCKSSIVSELFSDKYYKEISNGTIIVHSPLEAVEVAENQLFSPNGKTGVAWGLLDIGDSVKFVDNELSVEGRVEFKYYVGIARKEMLQVRISPIQEYGKWYKIVKADSDQVLIYYTENTKAIDSAYSVNNSDIKYYIYEVDEPDDDKYIFARMINSTKIELICAQESELGALAEVVSGLDEINTFNNPIDYTEVDLQNI